MNRQGVLDLLEANSNERGMKSWETLGVPTGGLRSYGIGLTQLRNPAPLE